MAPDMDPQKRNLIIYDMNSGTKFTLTATKSSAREQWLSHAQRLIQVHNTCASMDKLFCLLLDFCVTSPLLVADMYTLCYCTRTNSAFFDKCAQVSVYVYHE